MSPRVLTYARYSSDNQRDASIADQQRECRRRVTQEGWTLVAEYSDAAISGGTAHRPGFQALRRAAKAGECDIVLAEALDRLSRNQADTARLLEELSFAGVQIVTLAEGLVGELAVGFKGTMNALWRKDHAEKTRRGMRGIVLEGRAAGGLTYGYDVVKVFDGEPRGRRTINQAQAVIVRRIFREYADGRSAMGIAKALNREGIAGPRGRDWAASTINGQSGRGTGILNNELYIGRLVWNRLRYLVDPDSGRRQSRPLRRVGDLETVDVPHLRIVDDELWQAVKARQESIRLEQPRGAVRGQRPRYLLSGLAKCGVCGGGFTIAAHGRLRCFNRNEKGTCSNERHIARVELEARVLSSLRTHLLAPGRLQSFAAGYAEVFEAWRREQLAGASGVKQELAKVDRRRSAIVEAIAEGYRSEALRQELEDIERQRPLLVARAAVPDLPALQKPNMAALFRDKVAAIASDVAAGGIRRFIERIVIPPGDEKLRVNVNLHLADAIGGCGGPHLPTASRLELVA